MTILLIITDDDEYNDDFLGDASLSTPMSLEGSFCATIADADVVFVVVATAAATAAATAVVMLLEKCISNFLPFQREVSLRILMERRWNDNRG